MLSGVCSGRCDGLLDFEITVDGVFGPQVEAAVKFFQEGPGPVVDGTDDNGSCRPWICCGCMNVRLRVYR
jgi:peptidoglycan hydrolase-like protein with peptidoglycan-binding domain